MKPETREEWFCRIASEVIKTHGLASLQKTMHDDLFKFIHEFQVLARAADSLQVQVGKQHVGGQPNEGYEH